MRKYKVHAAITISVHTEVEAEEAEEAELLAAEQPMQVFCSRCAEGEPSKEWVARELDGEPLEYEVELMEDADA